MGSIYIIKASMIDRYFGNVCISSDFHFYHRNQLDKDSLMLALVYNEKE